MSKRPHRRPSDLKEDRRDDARGNRGPAPKGGGGGSGGGLWLFGRHPVEAALENPQRTVRRLVGTTDALSALTQDLAHLPRGRLPNPEVMARDQIERLLPQGAVHQGLALLAEPLDPLGLDDLLALAHGKSDCVILLLDQVTDPHNVGAILRSAAAFGALAVVLPDRHAPEETGTLAKSASGALERMPMIRVTNLARAMEELKAANIWLAGLAGEAPQTLAAANLSGRIGLVLGSEGDGLRRLTRETCDLLVRLPMTGAVESLNVSNAAAVALYECVRARLG